VQPLPTVPKLRVAVAALALTTSACGSPARVEPSPQAQGEAEQRLTEAVGALCDARREAASSIPTARGVFYDRAHDQLHELARRAGERDRPATARMLEAKNKVEQDFLYPKTWDQVAGDIATLDGAARAALPAVPADVPPPCPS
jgi:hypothetical protein